ncbi:MAG: penicillin acylase family protein, partial [Bacteroidales bacterium]|nr:penicillin acylase family protein [Bacteroidales bacterium]
MDLLRRVTLGRLSEIFGKKFVQSDVILRALRYSKKSEELLKTSDKEIVEALEAFADGVNQYIEVNKNKLPMEFTLLGYKPEPWEPVHSLNLIGYMAWDLKAGWSEFLLEDIRKLVDSAKFSELIPDVNLYKSYVFPEYNLSDAVSGSLLSTAKNLENLGVDVFDASNNWAVSAKKSATGKPLLANDMHLGLNAPGIWYQIHQVVKGKLNVTGLLLPGQPLIICGHNEQHCLGNDQHLWWI